MHDTIIRHFRKSQAHHDHLSELHSRLHKAQADVADHHADNPDLAASHRQISKAHAELAAAHESRADHFGELHRAMQDGGQGQEHGGVHVEDMAETYADGQPEALSRADKDFLKALLGDPAELG